VTYIDLSSDWTNSTVTGFWSIPPPFLQAIQPNTWYNPDDNRVYMWGGWAYNLTYYSYDLWSFTPWSNSSVVWELAPSPALNGLSEGVIAPFGAAFVASNTTFYSLGGADAPNTNHYFPDGWQSLAVQGLVEYDFASGTWSNHSTTDATQSGYTIQAGAALAPNFGKTGFLISIGGDIPTSQTYTFEASAQLADMSVITLYDLESKAWYHQKATGDIPPGRIEFCSVGAVSRENSFEM